SGILDGGQAWAEGRTTSHPYAGRPARRKDYRCAGPSRASEGPWPKYFGANVAAGAPGGRLRARIFKVEDRIEEESVVVQPSSHLRHNWRRCVSPNPSSSTPPPTRSGPSLSMSLAGASGRARSSASTSSTRRYA